ncbi:type VI secretion system-associated protein TagO [Inquilinus sp.]|uniref:type VI secretion system-associated protein TagO n=1 Tax=Inquilinus sp. TaxID=1932117 RepID=UPI0031E13963
MRPTIAALAFFAFSGIALADEPTSTTPLQDVGLIRSGVESCRSELADAARLTCFDELGRRIVGAPAPTASETAGNWDASADVDPLTDAKQYYLQLKSSNQVPTMFGQMQSAILFIRCKGSTTAAFVIWPAYLGIGDDISVRYRIDEGEVERGNWSASTEGKAAGLWNGSKAIPFLKRLVGAKKLALAMAGYQSAEQTATFDLSGIDEAIKPLREGCKW